MDSAPGVYVSASDLAVLEGAARQVTFHPTRRIGNLLAGRHASRLRGRGHVAEPSADRDWRRFTHPARGRASSLVRQPASRFHYLRPPPSEAIIQIALRPALAAPTAADTATTLRFSPRCPSRIPRCRRPKRIIRRVSLLSRIAAPLAFPKRDSRRAQRRTRARSLSNLTGIENGFCRSNELTFARPSHLHLRAKQRRALSRSQRRGLNDVLKIRSTRGVHEGLSASPGTIRRFASPGAGRGTEARRRRRIRASAKRARVPRHIPSRLEDLSWSCCTGQRGLRA